jgi:enoyl-CoA hydratase/carnithine racemase
VTGSLVLVDRPLDRVAHVRLNRPERRNALTGPLAVELGQVIEDLNGDDSVSVIIIGGAGGAFCSGLDLTEFSRDPQPDWVPEFGRLWRRVHRELYDSPKVLIAALERAAVNGGAALALACDFLVAGRDAFLQVGEVQQGMAAPMNMAWLRLRHSEALAARLALLGDRIAGPELAELGLAHVVVDSDVDKNHVVNAAVELAAKMAAHDPAGIRRIKMSLRRTSNPMTAEEWLADAVGADPGGGRTAPIAAEDR